MVDTPAAVALVSLVLWFAYPGAVYLSCPTGIMAKLYSNTMLVVLNARMKTMDGRGTFNSRGDFISMTGGTSVGTPQFHAGLSQHEQSGVVSRRTPAT
jgi:hypothetical protein